ncbi:MAG: hypothetical protein KC549_18590, partial [Myxococcales bacterium]|nr:hypothetical protein [Myxococcales bacterium]
MSRQATDTLRRTWRADLTKAGLRLLPGPGFGVTHLVRRARVEAHLEFDDGPRFQLTATHPGVPRDLLVRLEGERGVIRRTFGPGDVRTWDEAFDALAEVRGDPAWVLAALNPGTRKRLTDALNAGLTVKGGRLQGALVCERPAVLSAWVGFAADLVTRLSLPTDRVGPNLLRRAEAESEPRL